MGLLSLELDKKRQRLARIAQQQAFDCYLRHGRVPTTLEWLVRAAASEEKFLDFGLSVFTKAVDDERPTTHFVWCTAGDERVRESHAALGGRVFAWSEPPAHGFPGSEPNCRCWPEPYYGHPAIPDALLRLQRSTLSSSADSALWRSIETLRRPDGSLVESAIQMRDGTRIHSTFSGTSITNVIVLADGRTVTVEKRDGVRRVYLGNDQSALMEVSWAPNGAQVVQPRVRVAQVVVDREADAPAPQGTFVVPSAGVVVTAGLLALHNMLQAEPTSLGAVATDNPIIAFKVWKDGDDQAARAVLVEALTAQQVSQWCKRLPEVQEWTNAAATALTQERLTMTPREWGTAVHKLIEQTIVGLKKAAPEIYADLSAEISLSRSGGFANYGTSDSTRLDVLEDRRADMEAICVYDVKTGVAGLDARRVKDIAFRVGKKFPGTSFYIIEVRPFQ